MTGPTPVDARRAIEALRSGVPNRDAVRVLGSTQDLIEEEFQARLAKARAGENAGGLLVAGGFGSGKSHLLEYLQHRALSDRFVVSKVVISKETPLHDPLKVYRAAVGAALLPDKAGQAIPTIAESLRTSSSAYAKFYQYAGTPEAGLDERFAATLYLWENLGRDDLEFVDRIYRFWAGDPIPVGDLNRGLRACNQAAIWKFPKITSRDLALQRFRFASGLLRCAGYSGWVILFDEVELVGRYSLLQRARSYGEMARWLLGFEAEPFPGITCVLAITDDFDEAVLHKDIDDVPNRLRARGGPDDGLLAARAELGMRQYRTRLAIEPPSHAQRGEIYRKLKDIHARAFDWVPPDVEGLSTMESRPMRQYVRSWINEWDLLRLDPSYVPQTTAEALPTSYAEDPDLEGDDASDGG